MCQFLILIVTSSCLFFILYYVIFNFFRRLRICFYFFNKVFYKCFMLYKKRRMQIKIIFAIIISVLFYFNQCWKFVWNLNVLFQYGKQN